MLYGHPDARNGVRARIRRHYDAQSATIQRTEISFLSKSPINDSYHDIIRCTLKSVTAPPAAFIGDEIADALPPPPKQGSTTVPSRRHFNCYRHGNTGLRRRPPIFVNRPKVYLKAFAAESFGKKARQAETAANMNEASLPTPASLIGRLRW
jgi:hypothetical protein